MLFVIGTTHHRAPLEVREKLSLTAEGTVALRAELATLTGLAFPSTRFGMGHKLGFVSALVLLPTFAALYIHRLAGAWRWIYTTGCLTVLWLNGVIGVFQAFAKLDLLRPHAQPAVIDAAQLVLFVAYAALALLAAGRFHPPPPRRVAIV